VSLITKLQNVPLVGRLFGYDAVTTGTKRKAPTARTLGEDDELRQSQRWQMTTSTRDLQRNFTIAAWAIRKHLDYVSSFTFQARTGDDALDEKLEALMAWFARPINICPLNRFSLQRLVRMAEARRTIDGDVFALLRDDAKVQLIEGDRVANNASIPEGIDPQSVVNGVQIDADGRPVAYIVNRRRRNGGGLEFERMLSAAYTIPHGYYDRYDQVRGISPLAPAINALRDVYEASEYALAKMKVSQLFALAFFRENSEATGIIEAEEDAEGTETGRYNVDFGKGPAMLDLDPGDRAEFLESRTPSSEFQQYMGTSIQMALKALDIPLSFYDESHTNYSGARQALLQYQLSADLKRNDNRELLNRITLWRLGLFIADGELVLPRGMKLADLRWEWVAKNVRWVDPLKEVEADIKAVQHGFKSQQMIAQEGGNDAYEMLDQIAAFQSYAKSKGVTLGEQSGEVKTEEMAELERIKAEADAYGVGVRAGAITPQTDDEQAFRERLNLPPVSADAKRAWSEDKGVRRPITLVPSGGERAVPGQPKSDAPEEESE
jgi:capsid protein